MKTLMKNAVRVGRADRIPLGQGLVYKVDGREIAVFRQRDGRYFAVQNRCPHRNGPLADGIIGAGWVVCPLHSHRFDLKTGASCEQHDRCLQTYPVCEDQGDIWLDLPEVPAEAMHDCQLTKVPA